MMNNLAAVNFLDKCITSVGLKSFGEETANDPKLTKPQANRLLYCIKTAKHITQKIELELKDEYLASYKSLIYDQKYL